ncbi:unnamed protein product [Rotaria socialis]|nr:unnamed protein product [Rotaria socialis]CAF3415894.1 unnamed protein product [Rotaria socialis]CAF3455703.1 unnamed protein product [Rotaria socialis]CAF4166547.1 unnamed protein product [Rotaria socialis]CAF4298652.1 unnamed protein product [Rotaria socialis]
MAPTATPSFNIKFPSRKERAVKRVTKCETREIQKRLEPPKPVRVRPPPKPKTPKLVKPPATLSKPTSTARDARPRSNLFSKISNSCKTPVVSTSRTLQAADLEKLARINCSREFSLFHQCIKPDLPKAFENELAFLQTKLQLLKNEFENRQSEHLNFQQIKDYYNEALKDHKRRQVKPDEFATIAEKFRLDIKQAIDKWLRRKDFKPPKQVTFILQKRQENVREQIKNTMAEQKRQQQVIKHGENKTESKVTIESAMTTHNSTTVSIDDDDDIMIID